MLLDPVLLRFLGDALAISSRAALVRKIHSTHSISGLSLKTQILYLLVYIFRYIDIFSSRILHSPLSIYNSLMKVVYVSFQVYIISLFYGRLKFSYSRKYDTFNIPIFLVVSFLLFYNFLGYSSSLLYSCSLILESLAILPQLVVSQDSGECEKLTALHITLLGLYRLSYLIYFGFRMAASKRVETLLIVTSLLQSVLYIDFFRVYFGFMKESDDVLINRL